ncbi:RNA polymerase, sigma subunit, SigZ [Longilinea arvoryzae]|uniref:RNA polymerase sigma factor SigZ n=1 Tax=Longilinea arvoryzae TaxID=360412 RepID=A0A0S7BJ74_9CHLR|nr:RNA polymerase sigma factor SigZ [Longilinea arvoryzae]GAP15673.1 RNA polymerase, sigma subunit, SigZ [Longilinea arvoryzae]
MQSSNLESLWTQMHDRLHRFILSRVPDETVADDILQEVFLRIHTHLDGVRDMDRLESWIFQIARNSITDYYRARRRVVPLEGSGIENELIADEPEEPDAAAELAPALRELVEGLPELYRQALILTEYEGLSQKQAAERLGISFSGAKSRVQRARQMVLDALLSCCHFEFDVRGVLCCYRSHCCCCDGEELDF